ncbi:hypothetical protein D3C72_1541820 [compost metagenome]
MVTTIQFIALAGYNTKGISITSPVYGISITECCTLCGTGQVIFAPCNQSIIAIAHIIIPAADEGTCASTIQLVGSTHNATINRAGTDHIIEATDECII